MLEILNPTTFLLDPEILEFEHQKRLAYSYLSSWSGKEDEPENYLWVSYEIEPLGEFTKLTVQQSNYSNETAEHSKQNWKTVIDGLKTIVEKGS